MMFRGPARFIISLPGSVNWSKTPDCIQTADGEKLTHEIRKKYGVPVCFVETNAFSGMNIQWLFQQLARLVTSQIGRPVASSSVMRDYTENN
ncbi:MAG: hypothetical protein ACFFD4_12420 [Candidatus Odinarchaeota archaeon]